MSLMSLAVLKGYMPSIGRTTLNVHVFSVSSWPDSGHEFLAQILGNDAIIFSINHYQKASSTALFYHWDARVKFLLDISTVITIFPFRSISWEKGQYYDRILFLIKPPHLSLSSTDESCLCHLPFPFFPIIYSFISYQCRLMDSYFIQWVVIWY